MANHRIGKMQGMLPEPQNVRLSERAPRKHSCICLHGHMFVQFSTAPPQAGTSALGHSANKPQETHNYTPLETDPLEGPPVAKHR